VARLRATPVPGEPDRADDDQDDVLREREVVQA
jgi:hypothetical protein